MRTWMAKGYFDGREDEILLRSGADAGVALRPLAELVHVFSDHEGEGADDTAVEANVNARSRSIPGAPPALSAGIERVKRAAGDAASLSAGLVAFAAKVTAELEAAVPMIRGEFDAMMVGSGDADAPQPPRSDFVVGDSEHALHRGDWAWHSYITRGERQPAFAQRCPGTAALLEGLPDLMCGTPFDFAFFSTLAPGSTIAPHTAPCNLRLRCHLALDVPPPDAEGECVMRIADGPPRPWVEGRVTVFDDSFEHEVWNRTAHARTVLLLDFWHPDIEPDERSAIVEMFQYAKQEGWLK
jgi:aspartate beta-hydroxylase